MGEKKKFGHKTRTISLLRYFNWPHRVSTGQWWQKLAARTRRYPTGKTASWGIPFQMGPGQGKSVIKLSNHDKEIIIPINQTANYVCLLHEWLQIPDTIKGHDPEEGLVIGEYTFVYGDRDSHVQPVRARFEVNMQESPGPTWVAVGFTMPRTIDQAAPAGENKWFQTQMGIDPRWSEELLLYAMPNPYPEKKIHYLTLKGLQRSPLLVAGLTLYQGTAHPLRHLPRRTYLVKTKAPKIEKASVDLGVVNRIETTDRPRGQAWLKSPYAGLETQESRDEKDVVEITAAKDATLTVKMIGKNSPMKFSVGEAFHKGKSTSGKAELQVLGRTRQWMQIRVIDSSTGKPTPVRVHFSGPRGEYIAPYGHHAQINTNLFEDYGADVVVGGRNYAYVHGEFTTDMPVGDAYVEIYKGFEYEPVRTRVTIKPGQKELNLKIKRWKDLRNAGWVTADTHVHFISPHTAWLEGQCEGVNVVNLLASQWGRLFTNVGDITGKPGVVENDTIVFVGTENRNHMLGHMSMLGTKDLPVYPMCCGGVGESWIGDPDFMLLAEWARENKRKGGLVIRPHYPFCGHTEDPVPILKGLVDALEIGSLRGQDFPTQEWYRYLNCGYRVAVAGGTDKMGAHCALGSLRTYAKLDTNRSFTYENWAHAVRAGRTVSSNGPLIDMLVDGKMIGHTVRMSSIGGTVEVRASAECFAPLGKIEIVCNGQVVAVEQAPGGSRRLVVRKKIRITTSGWIAARCSGYDKHPSGYMAAHTSPVYVKVGHTRAFDNAAAEHMLALVEGGTEYLNTLATIFDESSRKRMVKLFKEARKELRGRLLVEGEHEHHHGSGPYHTHGHDKEADHHH